MKKLIIGLIIALIIIFSGVYVYFFGKEYIVRITDSQIKSALSERLPITKTYFFIIELTLQNPRVNLQEGSSRVGAGMDIVLNITVNGNAEPLGGSIDLSAGISYVPENGEFFLVNPMVENLSVQGLTDSIKPKVNEAIGKALTDYFSKKPIYTLNKTDLKQAAAYAVLKSVTVEGKEVVIVLGV